MVIGRSLLIFSYVTFKIAAWQPYWIYWFPDKFKFGCEYQLQTSVAQCLCLWVGADWFSVMLISKWPPGSHTGFFGFQTVTLVWLWISTPNFSGTILLYMDRSPSIFSDVNFKMAAWQPYRIFWFADCNFSLALNVNSKLQWPKTCVYG